LSFLPSLATREVFAFGEGVALPTRLKFKELPAHLRPKGEMIAEGGGAKDVESPEFIAAVIERWRGATMSHRRMDDTSPDLGSFTEPPALQAAVSDADRFRILKRPIGADPARAPQAPSIAPAPTPPPRWPTR
jgi:hypothetical protein